jgi:hypothetical protein
MALNGYMLEWNIPGGLKVKQMAKLTLLILLLQTFSVKLGLILLNLGNFSNIFAKKRPKMTSKVF